MKSKLKYCSMYQFNLFLTKTVDIHYSTEEVLKTHPFGELLKMIFEMTINAWLKGKKIFN